MCRLVRDINSVSLRINPHELLVVVQLVATVVADPVDQFRFGLVHRQKGRPNIATAMIRTRALRLGGAADAVVRSPSSLFRLGGTNRRIGRQRLIVVESIDVGNHPKAARVHGLDVGWMFFGAQPSVLRSVETMP